MIDLPTVIDLYREHAADLRKVRGEMRGLYRRKGVPWGERLPGGRVLRKLANLRGGNRGWTPQMVAQLDDIDAEVTYLLLRHHRPGTVVEISPCHGWSSCWILSALRDNGMGELHSFDILDAAEKNVPPALKQGRWRLVTGDVRANLAAIPRPIDFLFMDSDHSAAFAQWYIREVFPLVKPGGVIAVDDVFHHEDPGRFDGEGAEIIGWLEARSWPFFCASSEGFKTEQNAITAHKVALGLGGDVRPCTKNPTIFFVKGADTPQPAGSSD